MKHIYIYILFFLISLGIGAQTPQKKTKKDTTQTEQQDTALINRFSFRTNTVYWLLTVPNVGVEFDLIHSEFNKLTLNLDLKYNWNTMHSLIPASVFDLWEVRPEFRKYWRTEFRSDSEKMSAKEKLFSKRRMNPRYWRAYYAGIYASAAGYNFKFGKEGIKGTSYGIGVSAGFGIPLYSYKQHYIDLELGGSIGFAVAQYDKYKHDFNNNAYIEIPEKSKAMHFVPYPMVTDLHVSFVYRFGNSIKSKYKKIDHERIQLKALEKKNRRIRKDSIHQAKIIEDSLQDLRKQFVKDSIHQAKIIKDSLQDLRKQFVKDSIHQTKIIEDSLQDLRKQFVKDSIQNERLLRDSLKAVQSQIEITGEINPKGKKATHSKQTRKKKRSESDNINIENMLSNSDKKKRRDKATTIPTNSQTEQDNISVPKHKDKKKKIRK